MTTKSKRRVNRNRCDIAGKKQIKAPMGLKERFLNKQAVWLLALIIFAFSLNILDMSWGLSGNISWQPDAIEGEITINHLPLLFKQWRHKYPRGQFLINWLFYDPLIKHWSKTPVTVKNPAGNNVQSVITADRAKCLASISRWISATMSIGTIIAVFVLTKYLFGDFLAGWLAALTLSTTCLFLFHSGIGHIDVPFTFWFAWACIFTLRAALEHKLYHYIFAALCAGYAFCTKEGYFGYIPGLAVVYCVIRIVDQYQQTRSLKRAFLSILSLKVLVAVCVFVTLFLIMNGFLNFMNEFSGRMEYWKNDPIFKHKRPHLTLLRNAAIGLYKGMGWPLLLALIIGIFYFGIKYPKILPFVVLPVVIFYLITVLRIRFVSARFFIPAYVCFAVAIGKSFADWIRFRKIPMFIRYSTVIIIMGLTILFCIGLKLEMKNDTRIRAEEWFDKQVSKTTLIGSGMKRWYAPRLKYSGYRLIDGWHSEGIPTSQGVVKVFPEYLIMSKMFPCSSNYKNDLAFKEKLYDGRAGYKRAATFSAFYFSPKVSVFSIACWPYERPIHWISPTVDVFQKEEDSAANTK